MGNEIMFYIALYILIGMMITSYVEKSVYKIWEESGIEPPFINNYMRIRMTMLWPIFAIGSIIN
tara:strand:- start:4020 stop:4211 length:192 start_codon:yes stop_codon:yes gene_type:complete